VGRISQPQAARSQSLERQNVADSARGPPDWGEGEGGGGGGGLVSPVGRDIGSPLRPPWPLDPVQLEYRWRVLQKLRDGEYRLEDVPECLCGSSATVSVRRGDRFGLPVGMVMCRACGLLRTSPRLADSNLPAFYEDDYHALHFGCALDPASALFRKGQGETVYRSLTPLLPSERELSVIEVGCGGGTVLKEFADAAAADGRQTSLAGCEYAEAYVRAARAIGIDARRGGVASLVGLDSPHVVILSHVVEHFADPQRELTQLREIAGSATLLYVEVPGVLTIDRKPEYAYRLERYFTLAHTWHFSLQTLAATLARSGFVLQHGDETVRAAFTPASDSAPSGIANAHPTLPAETLRYLHRLETSRVLRLRRLTLRMRTSARGWARDIRGRQSHRALTRPR
jgi:SAM-dependent methyltransferase